MNIFVFLSTVQRYDYNIFLGQEIAAVADFDEPHLSFGINTAAQFIVGGEAQLHPAAPDP